jgi:LmbE family N-acetylglucosaminyl deacetylase
MISVTNGAAGHHTRPPNELVDLRREEAAAAGAVIGATYETWDFPDGGLEPTLEVRHRIIREIREFRPQLVLTHRTCDYHPDHRAVGQCVQDASYMVTVPHVASDVPALRIDPVVAYFSDQFTRPQPMRTDIVIDVMDQMDSIARMLACHRSQLFEWLAYHEDILHTVPEGEAEKLDWARTWLANRVRPRAAQFRDALVAKFGDRRGADLEFVELFEISEYARQPDDETCRQLFPHMLE